MSHTPEKRRGEYPKKVLGAEDDRMIVISSCFKDNYVTFYCLLSKLRINVSMFLDLFSLLHMKHAYYCSVSGELHCRTEICTAFWTECCKDIKNCDNETL
jgi:hypothetical protein